MLEIEYIDINEIKPYRGNAKKHPKDQIEQIKASMEEFGNLDPIGIWHDEIVEGHGRYIAAKELGFDKLPVIRLEGLTDEQRKAYSLVHNQLTMNSGFELFESEDGEEGDEEGYYGDERERTYNAYNLGDFDVSDCEGFYQMPKIYPCDVVPDDIKSFNYMMSATERDFGIHFYCDDYQFERIWNRPYEYIDKLGEFQCAFTPDFSLYLDMPMAMKIWNVYRSRMIGQIMQRSGLNVIPTVSWAEEDTFDFAFDGLPKEASLSISTIGVKQDPEATRIWKAGMDVMMGKLNPKRVLVYGGELEYDYGNTEVIYYRNITTDRMADIVKE